MYHYFYKITNNINGHFYYGVHSTNDLNDGYMGSGKRLANAKKKYGIENFSKEILKFFESDRDAYEYEANVVTEDLIRDNNCYNCMLGGIGYQNKGLATVKDKDGNCFYVSMNDPRYLTGEFVGCTKGMAVVKDDNDNIFSVSVNDPRYLSGELVGCTKGFINVKNEDGCVLHIKLDDPRYLSGELKPLWYNKNHKQESKDKIHQTHINNEHQKGEKNSQFGTCWVTKDGINKKIKKDLVDDYINNGYKLGRYIKPESENYKNKFVEKVCPVCGNKFLIKKRYTYGKLDRCCSKQCSDKLRSLHNMHKKNITWREI